MLHSIPLVEHLPIRQLAHAVYTALGEQFRLTKHSWGDNDNIQAHTPIDVFAYDTTQYYPIAAIKGMPNLSLEESIVFYQIYRPTTPIGTVNTYIEAVFPLFGDITTKHDHANYFENVLVQLKTMQYPLRRTAYEFRATPFLRITSLWVGEFVADPVDHQEVEAVMLALQDAYEDWKRIFS